MKRAVAVILLGMTAIAVLWVAGHPGVTKPKPQVPDEKPGLQEHPSRVTKKPGDFFPLTLGSTWEYQGEGNEFASFNRKVVFTQGDKAQVREDNGGAVSAAVFQTTDNAVTRIFFQGEAYGDTNFLDQQPNEYTVILRAPLAAGTKWEELNGTREIVDTDATVDTPAGRFDNCLKVKITSENSIVYEYFKDGVGMVKREFVSGDTRVISVLKSYSTVLVD